MNSFLLAAVLYWTRAEGCSNPEKKNTRNVAIGSRLLEHCVVAHVLNILFPSQPGTRCVNG
jgi:hypothetical protein